MKRISLVLFIILLLVVPFFLRLLPLRNAHYWDETVYLQHSEIMFSGRDNYSELNFRPPMMSILFFFGYLIWHDALMAHIIISLIGVIGIYFMYILGKELYNDRVGLIAALTLAYAPFIFYISHFLLTDSVALNFLIIALYFFVRQKRFDFVLAGLFLAVAFLTRFTSLSIVILFCLLFIFKKVKFLYLFKTLVLSLIFVSPYLIYSHIITGSFLFPYIYSNSVVQDYNVSMFYYLVRLPYVLYLSIIGIVAYFVSLSKKKGDGYDYAFLIWAVFYFLYMTKTPHKELRYIVPVVIPFFLLSAKGFFDWFILKINRRYLVFLLFFSILLFVSVVGGIKVADFHLPLLSTDKTEAMVVAEWMAENLDNESVIFTNAEHPVLSYYSGLTVSALYPRDESVYDIIYTKMRDDGYFLYKDNHIRWGSDSLVHPNKEFLDNDLHFTYVKQFTNYHLYSYQSDLNDFDWVFKLAGIDENFYIKELVGALAFEKEDFARADMTLILGRLRDDKSSVCDASDIFKGIDAEGEKEAVIYETIASLGCENKSVYLDKAAGVWDDLGVVWRAQILREIALGERPDYKFNISGFSVDFVVPEFETVTFGSSGFDVDNVLVQAERASRDWLSVQINDPYSDELLNVFSERFSYDENELRSDVGWHEGARVSDLGIPFMVGVGTLALKIGDEWYAPDENGVFRFMISKEKMHYPTTRYLTKELAMIVDTHGVNTLVEQALRYKVDTVIACCDIPSKVEAALYLDTKGVKVVCLTDRFLYLALGSGAQVVGSPYVDRGHVGGAVVAIGKDDKIVVLNGTSYYDAPMRYFSVLNMPNTYYEIEVSGVIDKARALDAGFAAVRVFNSSDYYSVKQWLEEDQSHKVMLFHSTSYPYGKLLFKEFPEQTTFDDPNPIFS